MNWLIQAVGIGAIIIATIDIFITVLYPRTGNSIISLPIGKATWQVFRWIADRIKNDRILAYCGSVVLIAITLVWTTLFVIGFALIFWSALGEGIQASQGKTPTDFGTAVYYSGFNFTTLGVGDLVPKTTVCRLVTIFEAALGFATFTVTLTYLLSVLEALKQRNIFALSLHHRTGTKANAAELLLDWGVHSEYSNAKQDVANMARDLVELLESHKSYPILHYFRFPEAYYSSARMILITMDTATLIKTALHYNEHKTLIESNAVVELHSSGLYTLERLADFFLPEVSVNSYSSETQWREWYYQVIQQLQCKGIHTPEDIEKGADKYVSLRREWNDYVTAFAKHMAYRWSDIAPAETKWSLEDRQELQHCSRK